MPDSVAQAARQRVLWATLIGCVLAIELILLLVALVPVMSAVGSVSAGSAVDHEQPVAILWWNGIVSRRSMLIYSLVSLSGALGGVLHGLASLTDHVAKRDFDLQWIMWYLVHPFVGAAVATVFVVVFQAGLGGQSASSGPGNVYGVGAFAALSGLFSRHALKTLRDVFDAVTGNRAPPEALDIPRILRLFPTRLTAGAVDAQLVIVGAGFAPDCTVEVADVRLPGKTSGDSVTVRVPAGLVEHPGALEVRVRSGCAWSNCAEVEVVP